MSLRRQAVQGPPGGMSVTYAAPSKPAPTVPSGPSGAGAGELAAGAYRKRPWLRKVHAQGGPEAVQRALARRRAQLGGQMPKPQPQQPEGSDVDQGPVRFQPSGPFPAGGPTGAQSPGYPGVRVPPGAPPNVTLRELPLQVSPPQSSVDEEKTKYMAQQDPASYPGFQPNQPLTPQRGRPSMPSVPPQMGPPMPPPTGAQEPAGVPMRPPLPPPMPQPPPGRPPQMSPPAPAPMPQVGLGKPQTQPMPVEPVGAPSAMPPQLGPAMQELVSSGQVPPWMVYQRMQQQSGGGLGLDGSGPRYM